MTESERKYAALRITNQFADLLQRDVSGPGPASYLTKGVCDSFKLMVSSRRRNATSSFLLCSLFSVVLGMPQGTYLDFPARANGRWLSAATVRCHRALFAAFGIQSQNILLRLTTGGSTLGPKFKNTWQGSMPSGKNA